METSGGIRASLSGRYATALFELARDQGQVDVVEASLTRLKAALAESADLQRLTNSPLLSRGDAGKGAAIAARTLGLDPLTTNFLGVLAANRRLREFNAVVRDFARLAAERRGETVAEVASAHPLTAEQVQALKAKLKTRTGRDVAVDLTVDPDLLGGLIVQIGSQRIDSSIRTRLNTLAHSMKG